jgi:translocation and assembly module TamA
MVLLIAAGCTVWADDAELRYKVRIEGAKDRAVKKAVKETVLTVTMRNRPPSTVGQLRRRMEKDVPRIEAILESRGYYDGRVTTEIDSSRDPMRVYFHIALGEQYRFRDVKLNFVQPPDEELQRIKPIIRKRRRVVAANVFEEQQRILDLMKRRGYPFAKLNRRTVEVDHEQKVVDLLLEFDQGDLTYFGGLNVEGLESLKPSYIERQVPWRQGRRYDSQRVRDFETKLLGTGLFGSARVSPGITTDGTNTIPINVQVNERDQRTIRLGVNYSDIGPGARIYWEHRNIFGGGERFETSVGWTPIELEGEARLTRTGFLDANQSLVLDLTGSEETPDAYDSITAKGSAMVLREFTPKIQGGIGTGYNYSKVEQFDMTERYAYVFFPLQVVFDYRDDRLNPLRGFQVFGRTVYNADTLGQDSFVKSYAEGRDYLMLWSRYRLSNALRLTLGSIDGAAISSVPANERFYAGGGGSIRGYEYQSVGPRLGDTPTGGNKMLEFSAELRLQPGNRLGYVAFVDGGTVYNDLFDDDASRTMRFGAGFGLRWFTNIGPLRADLAYPLNPADDHVERLQFYISLGQAF